MNRDVCEHFNPVDLPCEKCSVQKSTLREAAQQALEQVQEFKRRWWLVPAFGNKVNKVTREAITNAHSPIFELEHALRAALAEPVQEPTKETTMPITDDQGKALLPQYRVIEQEGNWMLLYDQMQVGEKARHEFRIQKLRHDIALYPGISLAEAQKRFRERVEADNE